MNLSLNCNSKKGKEQMRKEHQFDNKFQLFYKKIYNALRITVPRKPWNKIYSRNVNWDKSCVPKILCREKVTRPSQYID